MGQAQQPKPMQATQHQAMTDTESISPPSGLGATLKRNALLKATLNLFNLLVPLFVAPYINGLLHPDQLGLYNRALSEFQFFLIVGAFGIYNYGVRELSRLRHRPDEMRRVYTALFVIGIITNGVVSLAFIGFFWIRAAVSEYWVYTVLLLQMLSNVFYVEFLNEANENYRFIAFKTILIRLAYLIGTFVFVRRAEAVVPYALVISLTILFNNVASFLYIKRHLRFDFHHLSLRPHWRPLWISLLLTNSDLLYAQIDRVLLGFYGVYQGRLGDETVTVYNLSFTLIGMLASLPAALLSVSLPRLSNQLSKPDGFKGYVETLNQASERFFSLLCPLCFGVMAVAYETVFLYSREVYTYSWPLLVVACAGRLVYGLQMVTSNLVLYLQRAEQAMTRCLFLLGGLNLLLKGLLLTQGNLNPSVAMATTILCVAIYDGWSIFYARRRLGVDYRPWSARTLGYWGVSAIFLPISWVCHAYLDGFWLPLLMTMGVCIFLYGAYLLVTRDPLVRSGMDRLNPKR